MSHAHPPHALDGNDIDPVGLLKLYFLYWLYVTALACNDTGLSMNISKQSIIQTTLEKCGNCGLKHFMQSMSQPGQIIISQYLT